MDTSKKVVPVSHIVMATLILGALMMKLIPAVFAGFLVYTLTQQLSNKMLSVAGDRFTLHAKALALAVVICTLGALVVGAGTTIFIKGKEGLPWIMANMADILEKVRLAVPAALQEHVPATVGDLKDNAVQMLRTNSANLSTFGMETLKASAVFLLALVAGAMVSFANFAHPDAYEPLAGNMLTRLTNLTISFRKVVFAQVKISAINTVLTAIYLLGALPAFGFHLPLVKTLVAITFVAGLLPVVGNLISNVIIVVLSLGISPALGAVSCVFLVAIHKLEYFLNARIIGHHIDAAAWELIIAMIVMEHLFGVPGLVCAPVLYAYLKRELKAAGLIGRKPVATLEVGEDAEVAYASTEADSEPANVEVAVSAPARRNTTPGACKPFAKVFQATQRLEDFERTGLEASTVESAAAPAAVEDVDAVIHVSGTGEALAPSVETTAQAEVAPEPGARTSETPEPEPVKVEPTTTPSNSATARGYGRFKRTP